MSDNNICWLRLANGWTVSISEDDTPPAIWNAKREIVEQMK